MDAISLALILAVLVERLTEFVVKPVLKLDSAYVPYVAMALGVILAVAFHVDFLVGLGLASPYPYVGMIVSGLVIGGGSNFVNDIVSLVRTPLPLVAPESTTNVTVTPPTVAVSKSTTEEVARQLTDALNAAGSVQKAASSAPGPSAIAPTLPAPAIPDPVSVKTEGS